VGKRASSMRSLERSREMYSSERGVDKTRGRQRDHRFRSYQRMIEIWIDSSLPLLWSFFQPALEATRWTFPMTRAAIWLLAVLNEMASSEWSSGDSYAAWGDCSKLSEIQSRCGRWRREEAERIESQGRIFESDCLCSMDSRGS